MTAEQIRKRCSEKREGLLNEYFGDLVHEAAFVKPGKIDKDRYSLELPGQIVNEYRGFLENLLKDINPDNHKRLEDILNKRELAVTFTEDDKEQLEAAYKDANIVTLWEKIAKSNHEDVTYYKGLLKAYTDELLKWMEVDFVEDVCKLGRD